VAPSTPQQYFASLRALRPVDPLAYAAARLGTLLDDPVLRARIEGHLAAGWDALEAIDEARHHVPARLFELALAAAGPRARILDVGCGDGSLVNFGRDYAALENEVVAVDRRPPRIPFPPNVEFVQADLSEVRWEPAEFGLVLALHCIEQVADTRGLLARLRAALRPGGRALLAIPDARSAHSLLKRLVKGDDYDESAHFTLESFDALVVAAGFAREAWATWPAYHGIHHASTPGPRGASLGSFLDEFGLQFDRANGTLAMTCYGYGLLYRAV